SRAGLRTPARVVAAYGAGGLSGAPLARRATEVIATLYRLALGPLPIIGTGGIFNAEDAWAKICAGASLLQHYTGVVYEGMTVVAGGVPRHCARDHPSGWARVSRSEISRHPEHRRRRLPRGCAARRRALQRACGGRQRDAAARRRSCRGDGHARGTAAP